MAAKRNYKAEYAAVKERARKAGYPSVRAYKKARKDSGLTGIRNVTPLHRRTYETIYPGGVQESERKQRIQRMREESERWSNHHSHSKRSIYRRNMTDAQVEKYYAAYVKSSDQGLSRREKQKQRLDWMHDYLVPDFMDEEEWEQTYLDSN